MNKDRVIYIFISYILPEKNSSTSPTVRALCWLARTFKISPCYQFSFHTGHSDSSAWNHNGGRSNSALNIKLKGTEDVWDSVTFPKSVGSRWHPQSPSQEHHGLDWLTWQRSDCHFSLWSLWSQCPLWKGLSLEETLSRTLCWSLKWSSLFRTQMASEVQLILWEYNFTQLQALGTAFWECSLDLVGKYMHIKFHWECCPQTQKDLLKGHY